MRLSLQTVCIIFGVTLAHLFIISVLSPMPPEMPRPKIALDPELESLLEADAGTLAGEVPTEEQPITPAHPLGGAETNLRATPDPVDAPEEEAAAVRPAPNLAGNEGVPAPAPAPDESAALHPAPAVREIRTIAPAPRS